MQDNRIIILNRMSTFTGIFAKRDIQANEELCFHYGGGDFNENKTGGKPCLCAAPNCAGFVPNTPI